MGTSSRYAIPAFVGQTPNSSKRDEPTAKYNSNPAPIGKVKIEVFGGPHHGRILIIPKSTQLLVSLPASLPKGETFRETRTNPEVYAQYGRVTYERRRVLDGSGKEYLSFIEPAAQPIEVEFDTVDVQVTVTRKKF